MATLLHHRGGQYSPAGRLRATAMTGIAAAFLALFGLSQGASPAERVGVVMLHGKQSVPEQMASLVTAMRRSEYLVDAPEMCWSQRRIYDRIFPECLREIDQAVSRLTAAGAGAIVVAGHSQGANAALAYGASRDGLKGVIMLAPGHRPEVLIKRRDIAQSVATARTMLVRGHGDIRSRFADLNGSVSFSVNTTPRVYLSFFAEDSAAMMPANAPKLRAPLLYVVGTGDPLQRGPNEIFVLAPKRPLNRYVTVKAHHFDTLIAARDTVVAWLREVGRR